MADMRDDDVIIIEDGDELLDIDTDDLDDLDEKPSTQKEEPKKPNRALQLLKQYRQQIFFGISLLLLITFFAVLFNVFTEPEDPEMVQQQKDAAERIQEREKLKKIIKKSDVERLLAKANMLYESGYRDQALDIYRQISLYNESISYYNLGVARMKEADYEGAYDAFKTALQNRENRTAAAINAAACAQKLGEDEAFHYYIDLAEASLPDESASSLYSYYYALINYYQNRPVKALAAVKAPSSQFFKNPSNIVAADVFLTLGDYTGSLDALSLNNDVHDAFTLGLLHANIGEYSLAIEQFRKAIDNNVEPTKAKEALLLAYLKNSQFKEASGVINSMPKDYPWKTYPIEVFLKPRLFDIDLAQEYFANSYFLDKQKLYGVIFYFSPYEVVDATETFRAIQKGQLELNAGEIEMAKSLIKDTAQKASANANISLAVKLALNTHTAKANKIFKRLNDAYENHHTLEYNLGLSYAQLGNYAEAYDHFRRAQFLNSKNTLAGVFALFCADLSGKETEHIEKTLKTAIQQAPDSVEKTFQETLFNLYQDNLSGMLRWLDIQKEEKPLYLLTDILVADRIDKKVIASASAERLRKYYPGDVVTNILHLYANNKELPVKQFAFKTQALMNRSDMNFDTLFYGPEVARDLYIIISQISGNLPRTKQLLTKQLAKELDDRQNILQALAKTDMLLQDFEESFVLYNQLIDELKVTDTTTLLDASIAAIGGNHKENAIALLEIARLTDKRNFEARYGLGLLHQEVKNYPAAAIQYGRIDAGYVSRYFDFALKDPTKP